MTGRRRPVVAIVGGGFTGAAVAYHLAMLSAGAVRIDVFEPRERLGSGLAYDTVDPSHRINVPAARMSLLPDDEADFIRWIDANDALSDDLDALGPDGWTYPRRGVFGAYVADRLAPLVARGDIRHRRERAAAVERTAAGWRVTGASGHATFADVVVLAATHPAPRLPPELASLGAHPALVRDALVPAALDGISPADRVLLVGLGLTAADVVATLDRSGHTGPIIAIARRGLAIRPHALSPTLPFGDFATDPERTASRLLHRVRRVLDEAAAAGLAWQAVIDALRRDAGDVWLALSPADRRRIARHVRPYWDAHRFRAAPLVFSTWTRLQLGGRLSIHPSRIVDVRSEGAAVRVGLRPRGQLQSHDVAVDRVVVTTGPAHGSVLAGQDLFRSLAGAGHLRVDPTGLGIACDRSSRAIGTKGQVLDLFIAGPLARGTFGELMGLPQVTVQAATVAAHIADRFAPGRVPRAG